MVTCAGRDSLVQRDDVSLEGSLVTDPEEAFCLPHDLTSRCHPVEANALALVEGDEKLGLACRRRI